MYLCKTELFEIELLICIKMDLALNNLQRLICHTTPKSNKPNRNTTTVDQAVMGIKGYPTLPKSLG